MSSSSALAIRSGPKRTSNARRKEQAENSCTVTTCTQPKEGRERRSATSDSMVKQEAPVSRMNEEAAEWEKGEGAEGRVVEGNEGGIRQG